MLHILFINCVNVIYSSLTLKVYRFNVNSRGCMFSICVSRGLPNSQRSTGKMQEVNGKSRCLAGNRCVLLLVR